MNAAGDHGGRKMMRAGDHVGDDFGFSRIRDGRLENADDRGGPSAEADVLAHDIRIGLESVFPEAIGEDRSAGGLGAVVAHVQQATQDGMEAHDLKISTADNAGADFAGFAESDHGEADGGEIAELAKGVNAGFKVQNFRHGEVDVLATDAECALANVDEAILIGIHQRAKEDAAYQAEDGGVGMKFKNPFSPNTKKTSPSRMRAIIAAIFIGCSSFSFALLLIPQRNQRSQPLLAQVQPEPEQ